MKALILAAGRGQRMRPLTDHTPKPLLPVQGKPLMLWTMEALVRAGADTLVVNTDWLGEQIEQRFGSHLRVDDGPPVPIVYSHEGRDFGGALETAGGISRALPLLARSGDDAFWVVAGDVFMPGWRFEPQAMSPPHGLLGRLWLVPNPPHNPQGDFCLNEQGLIVNPQPGHDAVRHTFSTVGFYKRALFEPPWCELPPGNPAGIKAALAPLLRRAADNQRLSGSLWPGRWADVGTPARLAELNATPASTSTDESTP